MTDQTGSGQLNASGSRTGDVDVADPSRPDTTADVETGGATDLGAGGPEGAMTPDDSATRAAEDAGTPRRGEDETAPASNDGPDREASDADTLRSDDGGAAPREEREVEATHTAEPAETSPRAATDDAGSRMDDRSGDTRTTEAADATVATHATQAPQTTQGRDTGGDTGEETRGDTGEETRGDRGTADDRGATADDDEARDREAEAERQRSAAEFAREHDPEQHDVSAGEEFRQPGDWTADESGGPQVWDADGNLVEGSAPGESEPTADGASAPGGDGEAGAGSGGDRRTSSLDEIRDGGYGVGSAAPLDGGAMPLGHPVKAWEDTKTFVAPEHEKYGEAEPHVWFVDAHAAQTAGFRPVD